MMLTLGALGALVMGYAITSGATCMVAAVNEWAQARRTTRLRAMIEAGVWVGGGLLLAEAWHMTVLRPPGYAIGARVVLGGMLLGLGAWINRGCLMGAIARLGAGELAYALTPAGYFAGAALAARMAAAASPVPAMRIDAALLLPMAGIFAVFAVVRGAWVIGRRNFSTPRTGVWAPHEATLIIALAFLAMFLSLGPWTYPDLLADLATGRAQAVPARLALFAATLAGAVVGGVRAGKWIAPRFDRRQAVRSVGGGAVMAAGARLVPGGNDGLLLVGLPLGYPHALLGLAAMVATIALLVRVSRPV